MPADAVVMAAHDLELDQSSLTGETFPAANTAGTSAPDGVRTRHDEIRAAARADHGRVRRPIFVVNLVLQWPIIDSALFSLSLAVGLTPQLLPAIVGISLARGARRIARHRVIVKRLSAIEDFGAMSVLCTDKTGTMT